MRRRLLQRFQKRIERRLAQHVHLIDDVHFVFALLRRDPNLIDNAADVLHFVVGRRVKLKDVERHRLVLHVKFIDCAGENPRRRGLSNPSGTTKQIGLCNLP